MNRAVGFLLVAATTAGCTPGFVLRAQACTAPLGSACLDAFEPWSRRDARAAAEAFDPRVRAQVRACDELATTGPSPVPEAAPTPVVSTDDDTTREAPPVDPPTSLSARCFAVAMVRLRAASMPPGGEPSGSGLVSRLAPDAIPFDPDAAQRLLGVLCRSEPRGAACEVERYITTFPRAVRVGSSPGDPRSRALDAWVSPQLATHLIARWLERAASTEVSELEMGLVETVAAGLTADRITRRGGRREPAPPVTAELEQRIGAMLEARLESRVAAVEASAQQAAPMPGFDRDVRATLAAFATSARAIALAPRYLPRVQRAVLQRLEAAAAELIEQRRFGQVATLRALADAALVAPRFAPAEARVAEAAARHHDAEARRHGAAGRDGAALLHSALAAHYRGTRRPPESLRASDWPPALEVVHEGVPCPWASAATSSQRSPVRVTARWSECTSAERRWTTRDTYAYTVLVPATEERTESYTVSVPYSECRSVPVTNYSPTGGSFTTSRESCRNGFREEQRTRTVSVRVERPETRHAQRDTQRRELRTRAAAELTVTDGELRATVPFRPAEEALTEEAYATAHGRRAFSTTTLDAQRATVAQALSSTLGPDGRVLTALAALRAQRFRQRAAALLEADPDAAEEAWAQALLLRDRAADAEAYLERRHGVSPATLRALLP